MYRLVTKTKCQTTSLPRVSRYFHSASHACSQELPVLLANVFTATFEHSSALRGEAAKSYSETQSLASKGSGPEVLLYG